MTKIQRSILVVGIALAVVGLSSASGQANPLAGKIIALDAGHGGTSLGAQYPADSGYNGKIFEKDVNLAVVYALKSKLEADGAKVVLTRKCDEVLSNKGRADIATAECKLLGRKCDVLVSVHHNGNVDPGHDGTLVIYNGRTDKKFATIMHDALVGGLGLLDEGYLSGGYGITIFGNFVSVLTESYYITNTTEAEVNLAGIPSVVCDSNGDGTNDYSVLAGQRTQEEVNALYSGLINYFSVAPLPRK